jgi:uncharacterized protein YceH (UPF0502 family)
MALELDPTEQRVIGSLLEKERTVPDTYPMTLNGLRTACNQTSGRDPVLRLDEHEVQAALDRLRPAGLTRVVHPSHGTRMPKFRQVLDEVLSIDDGERALLTLLLLRGPQTPGELRSRSERLHQFASLDEVDAGLRSLAAREEPLVREQERRPGQKERRWTHLLGPGADEPPPPGAETAAAEVALADGPAARDERVVATYDAVATEYADQLLDELDGKPFDRWLLERLATLAAGGPAADVGCGPGQVTAYLALAGADATGFDLAPGMVDQARRRFPELTFAVADLHALPGPPDGHGWALVTAWYSLVHLAGSEVPATIANLARSLRPGGWLAVAVHTGAGGHHLDEWFGQEVDIDFTLHDAGAVIAAARAAGLEAVEWYHRGPYDGAEAETERLYVLGRRPAD